MSNQRTFSEVLLDQMYRGHLWMIKTIYLVRVLQLYGAPEFDWILAEKDKGKIYDLLAKVQVELKNSKKSLDDDFITKERALAEAGLAFALAETGLQALQASGVIDRLKQPETRRQALIDLGDWFKETCLLFGAGPETAFEVAALFIGGLERGSNR